MESSWAMNRTPAFTLAPEGQAQKDLASYHFHHPDNETKTQTLVPHATIRVWENENVKFFICHRKPNPWNSRIPKAVSWRKEREPLGPKKKQKSMSLYYRFAGRKNMTK